MFNLTRRNHHRPVRRDYWLSGQFTRSPHPQSDQAMAAWSQLMGEAGAKLWLDACREEGRCR
jgi:hypothetical protein